MKIDIEEIELCLDMHYLTEIVATHRMDPALGEGLSYTVARGRPGYGRSLTVRPMIQVLAAGSGSCLPMQQVPCADCGDFSRSWNCEAHTYWSPIGDADDLAEDTAFSDGPVMRDIRRMIADAYQVPDAMMPHTAFMMDIPFSETREIAGFGMPDSFLRGLQDISIDFTVTEEGLAALNEALASGPRRRIQSSLHSIIEQFGLDDED